MKFSVKDIFTKIEPNTQFSGDFFTFTKEVLDGKLHVLCGECFKTFT